METKTITKGLDILIYLGILITLITSVYNVINVVFSAIDFKFGENFYGYDIYNSSIRMAVALLVVMYPTYLALSFYIAKVVRENPERVEFLPRKLMIFVSIFVTASALIGSLVSTVYTYLGGDLSLVFALKVLTVIVVASMVGGYYLYTLKRDVTKISNVPYIFAGVSSLVVLLSIVWSVNVFGTPSEMRDKKEDSQRLSDISSLQGQILNYWQQHKALPENLEQLNDPFNGFSVPRDPVTKESYDYSLISQSKILNENGKQVPASATFKLCATFITERSIASNGRADTKSIMVEPMGFYYSDYDRTSFWNHGIGLTCFEREIKKEMYRGQ